MKRIFLTVAVVVMTLLATFVVACSDGEKPSDNDYTVTLNKQTVSLIAFDRYELTAVVRDSEFNEAERPVSWKSGDESVCKVSDGVIFATGAGTTEISATLENNAFAKCTVTVTDNGVIPELRVNQKALSIGAEQQFTVISQVFFNGKDCTESDTQFTYTSSRDSVATVSADGVITAKAAGSTKITVYALWRGIGGPDKIGDVSAVAGLSLTIDVNVVVV